MEVAVARVTVGRDGEPAPRADLLRARDHLRDARARHRDVLGELQRVERLEVHRQVPPRLPHVAPLRLVLREHHLARGVRPDELRRRARSPRRPAPRRCRRSRGAARRPRPAGSGTARSSPRRASATSSSSSRQRGRTPEVRIRVTARAAASTDGERDERGRDVARPRQELQRHLGHDPERPLAPDEEAGEVVAGDALDRAAPDPEDLARSAPPTVRPSTYSRVTPYLSARGPPGVLRDVPADRAHLERVRVRRVEEAVPLDLRLRARR